MVMLTVFCLGTGVPRHSAGGVGTSVNVFITLNWCSERIMHFAYEYLTRLTCASCFICVKVLLLLVLKHLVKVQLPGCCPEQTV